MINESLLKLEVADPPEPKAGRGVSRPSPVWERVRDFVEAHAGAWCRVLEVPVREGQASKQQTDLATRVRGRMSAERYETKTRREGDVIRAYARVKAGE